MRSGTIIALCLLMASAALADAGSDLSAAVSASISLETLRVMKERGLISGEMFQEGTARHQKTLDRVYAAHPGERERFARTVAGSTREELARLRAIYPADLTAKGQRQVVGLPWPLPLPEEVVAPVRGADGVDTAARQSAALELLIDHVRNYPGLDPGGMRATFLRLYRVIFFDIEATQTRRFDRDGCKGKRCDRYRFVTSVSRYQRDPEFINEVLGRHFPEGVAAAYLAKKAQQGADFAARHPPPPPFFESIDFADIGSVAEKAGIWIAVLAVLAFLVWLGISQKKEPPPLSDNYGKATFAELAFDLPRPDAFLCGVFLGKSSEPPVNGERPWHGAPVFTTFEHHTLVVARTRTGKGTRVIVPTLLRYSGSILVLDPKGENAAITGRTRKTQLGQTVHIVNPWHELAQHFGRLELGPPATYNPLDVLDRNDPNAVAIAQALAGTVCPAVEGKDRFWYGTAANVFAAVLLWLADHPGEQKTLARAREIVSKSRKDFTDNFLVKMAASSAYGGAISEMVSQLIDMANETYSGVMSNLSEATKFLSDPMVKASTETSSFRMEDLIFTRTTVYLVIPPERMETQKTWLRLVLTAAMHVFKKHRFAENRRGRCMFLIDEFAALGRMDDIPRDIATMSGYGLDMTLVVQGLDQLRASYEQSADTIINNCAYKWFCNVSDLSTAKYVSESIGNKTVQTVGVSRPQDAEDENKDNISYGETGRPLMRHEEVLTLGRDTAIAFQPQGNPLYLQPIDYWNLPKAFHTLETFHPALYWDPPVSYDGNPYVKEEATA